MQTDAILEEFCAAPDRGLLTPAAMRLARWVPSVRATLDGCLDAPLHRALVGLQDAPAPDTLADVGDAVTAAVAASEGGAPLDAAAAQALELRAEGDPVWWVPAARLHVFASPAREQRARMALSDQELPYVFPGDLHPLQVEVLAVGDRALEALHVDWMRKLSAWMAAALVLDLRAAGLWFWPNLRSMSERRLLRPLQKVAKRRLGLGGRGLTAAYIARMGGDPLPVLAAGDAADRLHFALAEASTRAAVRDPAG